MWERGSVGGLLSLIPILMLSFGLEANMIYLSLEAATETARSGARLARQAETQLLVFVY